MCLSQADRKSAFLPDHGGNCTYRLFPHALHVYIEATPPKTENATTTKRAKINVSKEATGIYIYIYMLLPPPPKAHRFHDFRHNLARYCSASTLRRHQAAQTQEAGTLARTPTLGSRTTAISGSSHGTGISLSLLLVKMCTIPCSY